MIDFSALKAGINDGSINEKNLNNYTKGLTGWKLAVLRFLISTVP